jgi:alpha-D-ribose 1-methylphosphonate 5-triphosphate diphosphatase
MEKQLLINCHVILTNDIAAGSAVLIEKGCISAVEPEGIGNAQIFDLGGAYLMPGMIDLHCDALEKEIEPRPQVLFPMDFAIAQADRRNAQAGITTVYHALSFAHGELGVRNRDTAADIARHVKHYKHGLVDNRVHGRYEITDAQSLSVLTALMQEGALDLVSVMDHTPGQGQFKDLSAYRSYLESTYRNSTEEAETLIRKKIDNGKNALERVEQLAANARTLGIRVASHDDDHPGRVHAMAALGGTIFEFPINADAAKAACDIGLWTVFGAPNILRGASQSGSIKALEAIEKGLAGCLCSDYHPGTLLAAVFKLPELTDITLAEAVQLVTANPAKASGCKDRGCIQPGKKADLIGVRVRQGMPSVSHLWVDGQLRYHEGIHGKGREPEHPFKLEMAV